MVTNLAFIILIKLNICGNFWCCNFFQASNKICIILSYLIHCDNAHIAVCSAALMQLYWRQYFSFILFILLVLKAAKNEWQTKKILTQNSNHTHKKSSKEKENQNRIYNPNLLFRLLKRSIVGLCLFSIIIICKHIGLLNKHDPNLL